MQKILENALEIGRKYIPEGECASYIPELAKADKNHLGVCIRTRGMETFSAGDTKERFTIQIKYYKALNKKLRKEKGL